MILRHAWSGFAATGWIAAKSGRLLFEMTRIVPANHRFGDFAKADRLLRLAPSRWGEQAEPPPRKYLILNFVKPTPALPPSGSRSSTGSAPPRQARQHLLVQALVIARIRHLDPHQVIGQAVIR